MMIGSRFALSRSVKKAGSCLICHISSYLTQKLSISDVLNQSAKTGVKNSEFRQSRDDLLSDDLLRTKKRAPEVKDVKRIFAKWANPAEKRPRGSKEVKLARKSGSNKQKKRQTKAIESPNYVRVAEQSLCPETIEFKQAKALEVDDIPRLSHNLDRVLFLPGVQFLQDPRTRIYNYDPHLDDIIHIDDFNFDMVQGFVSVSKDEVLLNEAIKNSKQFYSSTLSMTLTLHQLYLLLNNYTEGARSRFDFPAFSRTCKTLPLSVIIEPKGVDPETGETIYSVSADKSNDVEILLGAMGHCLEVFLTHSPEELKKYEKEKEKEGHEMHKKEGEEKEGEENEGDEKHKVPSHEPANVYNYLTCGAFLMRSQLDCYDSRLPGNGTFDLKTRAVCAIRHDRESDASQSTYQIWKMKGKYESFEREFNDLIRTGALLKYGFQARIGQMDGIFIAYHNVRSFFGFQYVPLLDINQIFYSDGSTQKQLEESPDVFPELEDNLPSEVAETQFKVSLAMLQDLLQTAIADFRGTRYEGKPFRLVMKTKQEFESRPRHPNRKLPNSMLHVYAVPLLDQNVKTLQQFSDQFETSFRAEISTTERHHNLQNYKRELDAFNASLVQNTDILHYTVKVDVSIDGKNRSGPGRHPYPSSSKSKSVYNYQIRMVGGQSENRKNKQKNSRKGEKTNNSPRGPGTRDDNSGGPETSDLDASKCQYLLLMKSMSSTLTMSIPVYSRKSAGGPTIVDQMRRYSAVGERRKAQWRKLPAHQFRHH